MSNTSGIEAFDSELLRAFLTSQSGAAEGGALSAAKQFISSKLQENITSAGSDKVTSELLKLLNKLEVTTEIISQLKESFTEINEAVKNNFSKLNIPEEEELKDPVKLLKTLKQYNAEEVLKEIKKVKDSIKENPEISLKDKEVIENLERSIKFVLKEFPEQKQNTQVRAAEAKEIKTQEEIVLQKRQIVAPEKLSAFEKALDKLSLDKEFLSLEKSADKLIKLLRVVADKKDYEPVSEEKILKVIRQQIDLIKNIEEPIKKLLISPSSESQLTTLIRVLENIKVDELPAANTLQNAYKEFISELTSTLKDFLLRSASEAEIKEYLTKVLEKIYKDFKLEPPEVRLYKETSLKGIEEFLKPEQIVNLKLIEAQISLILNSPKESLFEEVGAKSPENAKLILKSNQLKVLLEMLDKPEAKEISERIKPLIQEILKNSTSSEAAEKEVRKILGEISNTGFVKELIGKAEGKASQILPEKQQSQLNLISDLIKEVLRNEGIISEEIIQPQVLEKIVSSPAFKNLIQVLRKTDQSLPAPHSQLENDLVEFSGALLEKIEKGKSGTLPKLQENLAKALERLESKFPFGTLNSVDSPLSSLNLSSLKNLENIASSQEMMQKLNPVLKNLGEPIVVLFPFVMQGMLSRIEVNIAPHFVNEEEKKKKRKSRSQYETLKFSLKLPSLGKVTANVAHSSEEVLILVDFENKEAGKRVEPAFVKLESTLQSLGYSKVSIALANKGFAASNDNWVSKLLKNLR